MRRDARINGSCHTDDEYRPKAEEHRAESLVRRFDGLPGLTAKIRHTAAKIGGGSTPDITLSSRAIAIHVDTQSASAVEQQLRAHVPLSLAVLTMTTTS
ncbi:MAG: hypothetical protein Ct9H300mP25_15670 [Acidobacteriota bacterium]|nr:MAG: hypothetical protein Ct9H300mP25_15670 [Acidobacteriota bacterium]